MDTESPVALCRRAICGRRSRRRPQAAEHIDRLSCALASALRGRRYNRAKKPEGAPVGNKNRSKQLAQSELVESTAAAIAKKHGVSEATVKRDGKQAEYIGLPSGGSPCAARKGHTPTDPARTIGPLRKCSETSSQDGFGSRFRYDETLPRCSLPLHCYCD